MKQGRSIAGGVVCALFAVGIVIAAQLGAAGARARLALMESGAKAEGVVADLHPETRTEKEGPWVSFTFPAGGLPIGPLHRVVLAKDWETLKRGDRFDVWYNPAEPIDCMAAPERAYLEASTKTGCLWVVAGVFLAGGLILLLPRSGADVPI